MTTTAFHRLFSLVLAAAACALGGCASTSSTQSDLAPGQYQWHPERSPSGPILVVVSIDDQMAYVYRNGVEIARSTVSTGREGKETPTGVFTVLQRKVEHESSIYKGAQMPYMQRLTWTGIAMHAGELPGYPASAGCVRMPLEFSEKVFGVMHNGATVAITRKGAQPSRSAKPADVLMASNAARPSDRAVPEGEVVWEPGKSSSGPYSILMSYADQTVYIWRNGIQIGQAPLGIAAGTSPPEGVFMMLEGSEPSDSRFPGVKMHPWSVLSIDGGNPGRDAVAAIRAQVDIPNSFQSKLSKTLTPGTILVATRESSNASTRSGTDFSILAPEEKE
ncbi:MAG: L,D-transpeptidase family protein [Verrucomicrobiales bacterium]